MKRLNLVFVFSLSILTLFSCEKSEDFSPAPFNENLPEENASDNLSASLSVTSIDEFSWIAGNPAFAIDSKNRLWRSTFTFQQGGSFTYTFYWDNTTNNKYTLRGEYYKASGNRYAFYAVRNTNNGAGSGTQVLVEGTIAPLGNGQYVLEMDYGSSANNSAIVNNQLFLSNASKRFHTVLTVE